MAFVSVSNLSSAGGAAEYIFGKDKVEGKESSAAGYYYTESKDLTAPLNQITWHGEGAKHVGFEAGSIASKDQFEAVYSGHHAETGERYRNHSRLFEKNNDGSFKLDDTGEKIAKERIGMDVTLSLPKSFSLVASQDRAFAEALQGAALESVGGLAGNLTGKTTQNGETHIEKLDAVYAVATHHSSRPVAGQEIPDANLHFHSVFNSTGFTANGRPLAVDTSNFYAQREATQVDFSLRTAQIAKEFGYAVEATDRRFGVSFEIKGISQEMLDATSQRAQNIDQAKADLKEKYPNASDYELGQMANILTRESKAEAGREEVAKHVGNIEIEGKSISDMMQDSKEIAGLERKAQVGAFDVAADKENRDKGLHEGAADTDKTIHGAVRSALDNLAEKDDYVTAQAVVVQTAKVAAEGQQIFTVAKICEALENLKTNGEIASLGEQRISRAGSTLTAEMITPARTLKQDMVLAEKIEVGRGKASPAFSEEQLRKSMEAYHASEETKFPLTEGQQQLARTILASQDKFTFVQGDAGTGKTSSLKFSKAALEEASSDKVLVGFAPTGAAVSAMNAAGISADTVDKLLVCKEVVQSKDATKLEIKGGVAVIPQNVHIVLDEASMIDTSKAYAFVDKIDKAGINYSLTAMGDIHQHKSIGAGRFHENGLAQGGEWNAELTERVRQKTAKAKELTGAFMRGGVEELYKKADELGALHVVGNGEEPASLKEVAGKVADLVVNDHLETRENGGKVELASVMAIASTNAEKREIGNQIREKLQENGLLSNETITTTIKHTVNLSGGREQIADNYVGEDRVVIPNRDIEDLGLKSGHEYQVVGSDTDKNTLYLIDKNGEQFEVDPAKNYGVWSVYEKGEQQLAIGEEIRNRKNDKLLGVPNGATGTLVGKDENGQALVDWRTESGETVQATITDANNVIESASVMTGHSSQGQSIPKVYALVSEESAQMNDRRMAYIQSSRHESEMGIVASSQRAIEISKERGAEADQNLSVRDKLSEVSDKDFDAARREVEPEAGQSDYAASMREEQQKNALDEKLDKISGLTEESGKDRQQDIEESFGKMEREEKSRETIRETSDRTKAAAAAQKSQENQHSNEGEMSLELTKN